MRRLLFFLVGGCLFGQDLVRQGKEIFDKSCATGYCHGQAGATSGGAPRLAARGFDEAYINTVVSNGVPGTSMPAFANSFERREVAAVVAYLATLNGLTPSLNAGGRGGPLPVPPQAGLPGRELFQDSLRRSTRCSTCHEVAGIGIPVAAPIVTVPPDVDALREMATPRVSTVSLDGETMPALIISEGKARVLFYDLTGTPPVLRTAGPEVVRVAKGSAWRHASALAAYQDAELTSILEYLRASIK